MASITPEETKPTKRQVRAVLFPAVPPLVIPHYEDPGLGFSSSHAAYHSLGHCLRADIFPVEWTERNILNQKLNKMLKERETKTTSP
ncbi:unnamed protein product [Merluccius merluccius]